MVSFWEWSNIAMTPTNIVNTITDSRSAASDDKSTDQRVADESKRTWDQDRAIVGGEYAGLMTESGAGTDPKVLNFDDGFDTMKHQDIYNALSGVDSNMVNFAANGWRDLAGQSRTAVNEFSTGVEQSITELWNGQSGSKAIEATRAFATSFTSLAAGFQLVGHGLDLMEGHLAQAKGSVGQPDNYTFGDKVIDALPFQNVVKGPTYRAEEAEAQARYVMKTYYQPGVQEVDGQTPTLAEPKSQTSDDPGSKPKTPDGSGSPSKSGSPTTPQSANPQGNTPQSSDPKSEDPSSKSPESNNPQTNPQSSETNTKPSSADTGSPTTPQSASPTTPTSPSTPGSGVPSSGSPHLGGSGSPGSSGASPSAGKSVGGTGAGANSSSAKSSGAGRSGTSGRSGTPGMGGMGGGRGKGDEDDEHSTPDYLVYDRGDELLGTQPPALPPGGVIGG